MRRCSVKNDIVYNLFHDADTTVDDGRVQYTDTFGVNQRSFWCHPLRVNTAMFVAPTLESLRAYATAAACSSGPPSRATRTLTTNEFARLVSILLEAKRHELH